MDNFYPRLIKKKFPKNNKICFGIIVHHLRSPLTGTGLKSNVVASFKVIIIKFYCEQNKYTIISPNSYLNKRLIIKEGVTYKYIG
jgi:hypothetical protein